MAYLIGNRNTGYDVKKYSRKSYPYEARIWNKGKIVWRDTFETKYEAEKYLRTRAKFHGVK